MYYFGQYTVHSCGSIVRSMLCSQNNSSYVKTCVYLCYRLPRRASERRRRNDLCIRYLYIDSRL